MNRDLKEFHERISEHLAAQRGKPVIAFAFLVSIIGAMVVFILGYSYGRPRSDVESFSHSGPTIEHIQSLSQLISTKVSISDVMEGEGDGVRGVWLVKGDALLGIDLSKVSQTDVEITDAKKRVAILHLPAPTVFSARVDHEHSMTYDVHRTTWIPWKGDTDRLRDRAMYHAQKLVEFAAHQPELIEEAKRNASRAMTDVYRTVDWQVEVRWR
jgi:hypothetical protein